MKKLNKEELKLLREYCGNVKSDHMRLIMKLDYILKKCEKAGMEIRTYEKLKGIRDSTLAGGRIIGAYIDLDGELPYIIEENN